MKRTMDDIANWRLQQENRRRVDLDGKITAVVADRMTGNKKVGVVWKISGFDGGRHNGLHDGGMVA